MTRLIHILAIGITLLLLVPFIVGCQPNVTPQSIAAAGGTATGQLQGAKADVTAAMSHADQYGKGLLTSAETAIAHVLTTELPTLEAAGPALEKVQKDFAKDHAENTWFGWKLRGIVRTIAWCLAGAGLLSIALFIFAGANPLGIWKEAASIILKVLIFVPNGISQAMAWMHMHRVKQAQIATAVTNTASLPPDTIKTPPTPAQIKVLKRPKKTGDPPLVRQLNAMPPVIPSVVPPAA